jgi:hypothetical protein
VGARSRREPEPRGAEVGVMPTPIRGR